MHSTASDGSLSPSEILEAAKKKGLSAVALTDHDTVGGIPEFLDYAKNVPHISAVPGVELSVDFYDYSIHIVGLLIDHKKPSLNRLLSEIRDNRNKRNFLIIEKLQSLGYDITLKEVQEIAGGESVGRPHFARVLVKKQYFSGVQEVFDRCLKKGAPGYCMRKLPSPEEAIKKIHQAGGAAFWAHPMHRGECSKTYVLTVLKTLIKMGLDGIETYYSTFTPEQQKLLLDIAEDFNLLASGGSDFHGENMPGIDLGCGYGNLAVPEDLYVNICRHVKNNANNFKIDSANSNT